MHTLMVSPGAAAAIAPWIVLKPGALHEPPGFPVPGGAGATHQVDEAETGMIPFWEKMSGVRRAMVRMNVRSF